MQKGSCSGSFVRGRKWATASKKRVSVIYEGDSWLFVQLLSTTHTHTHTQPLILQPPPSRSHHHHWNTIEDMGLYSISQTPTFTLS